MNAAADRLNTARTLLFVPGIRPERFDKAVASGADLVILDLEDSVGPDQKDEARTTVAAWLDPSRPVVVRVNAVDTPWFESDWALCRQPGVAAVIVPRAEPGVALALVAQAVPVLALIETARGVEGMRDIVRTRGVRRLGLGLIDLSLDLGVAAESHLDPVLLQTVIASRAGGCAPPVAPVTPNFHDLQLVEREAARARSLGFTGKLCIHPAQLAAADRGLRPTAADLAEARRIIDAAQHARGAATSLDGRMIDRPVVERAQRLLAGEDQPGRSYSTPASDRAHNDRPH